MAQTTQNQSLPFWRIFTQKKFFMLLHEVMFQRNISFFLLKIFDNIFHFQIVQFCDLQHFYYFSIFSKSDEKYFKTYITNPCHFGEFLHKKNFSLFLLRFFHHFSIFQIVQFCDFHYFMAFVVFSKTNEKYFKTCITNPCHFGEFLHKKNFSFFLLTFFHYFSHFQIVQFYNFHYFLFFSINGLIFHFSSLFGICHTSHNFHQIIHLVSDFSKSTILQLFQ